jgi:hypothetical protein
MLCDVLLWRDDHLRSSQAGRTRKPDQSAGNDAGVVLFWQAWALSCMGVWAAFVYIRHRDVVPMTLLPILFFAGMIVYTVTQAIATLVQYKRSAADDAL